SGSACISFKNSVKVSFISSLLPELMPMPANGEGLHLPLKRLHGALPRVQHRFVRIVLSRYQEWVRLLLNQCPNGALHMITSPRGAKSRRDLIFRQAPHGEIDR